MEVHQATVDKIEEDLYKTHGQDYPQGSVIYEEGDSGHCVYVIRVGRVQVTKSLGERSKVIGVMSPGDFFGETALISQRPRSTTATAIEDCRLVALDGDTFFKLLRNSYDITLRIVEQLSARLADADRRLETLLFTDATARLVRFLEGISEGTGPVDISQIAYELGVPLERLQRIADKFADKGIIAAGPEGLSVVDRGKLDKLKSYLTLKEEFGHIEEGNS